MIYFAVNSGGTVEGSMGIVEGLKAILKQPYWVILFAVGAVILVLPCVSYDKVHGVSTHNPQSWFLAIAGATLILLSLLLFSVNLLLEQRPQQLDVGVRQSEATGLDTSQVEERDGAISTKLGDCEIQVIFGRIENYQPTSEAVVALPCNEYFDDVCIADKVGALGSYVSRAFAGRIDEFVELVKVESHQRLGPPEPRPKTKDKDALSFGVGRALLLRDALRTGLNVALVSTTTERAGEGLIARISYMFNVMSELVTCLDETPRVKEIAMPVLGSGHGGVNTSMAFVGTVLALAEVIRYSIGARRLKRATIVVFRRDQNAEPEVHPAVVRRALALIAQRS